MPHSSSSHAADVFVFGPFRLFVAERLLEKDDKKISVGGRALDLLVALVERAGEVVSHKELTARVWPDVTVEEANLRVHIAALRRALGDDRGATRYISSVAGRGYCFVAPVNHSPSKAILNQVDVSLPLAPNNHLPMRLLEIVGRDETERIVSTELITRRFVSIVGPGGVGKTIVAVSVAHKALEGFGGAVFLVDLI
jgi:DNA-binding winged helix-turn-helix (wHTH) protein